MQIDVVQTHLADIGERAHDPRVDESPAPGIADVLGL